VQIKVNGVLKTLQCPSDKPLLWALREDCQLTGPKFGCGQLQCGACTVLIDGVPQRTCLLPVSSLTQNGAVPEVLTIEGLQGPNGSLHPVQTAWLAETVSQCGYCQGGQVLCAVALLASNPAPTDADIDAAMINACRCGTYPRIRQAIKRAAGAAAAPK
jgi:isoquinoline 1-oxidoreductase alpha subunit